MAQPCLIPTFTSTQAVRTQSVFTTFSTIVSTIPASTLNITTTISCGNTSCPSTVLQTEVPAHTVSSQVPVILTSQIDAFFVSTFWGSSCARSSTTSPSSIPPSSTPNAPSSSSTVVSSSSPLLSPSSSPSSSSSILSSSPSRPSSTQSSPRTTSIAISPGSSILTSNILVGTVAPPQQTVANSAGNTSGGGNSKFGAIVGGVIGGVVILGILALTVWYFLRKQANDAELDILFEKAEPPLSMKAYHFYDDHSTTTDLQQSLGQHQEASPRYPPDQPQQEQPQSQYHENFDQQEQHHPSPDKWGGHHPNSHQLHHQYPQLTQQPQQYPSPDQTQGYDPSYPHQYPDPRPTQQQQLSPNGWQVQDQGQAFHGSDSVGGSTQHLQGTHDGMTSLAPVSSMGGVRHDSTGFSQGLDPNYHHNQLSSIQYAPCPTSGTYTSMAQIPPTAGAQETLYPNTSYMSAAQDPAPALASEPLGSYERYADPGMRTLPH